MKRFRMINPRERSVGGVYKTPPGNNYGRTWMDFPEFKPPEYDLVSVIYEDGSEQVLWWTGKTWDGFKKKKSMDILRWIKKI